MRNLKVFCRRHCGILLFVGMELWTGTFLKTLRKPGKASPQDGCEFPHPVAFEQEYDANLFHEAVPEILSDVRELRVFPCEDDVVAVHAVETGGRVVSERQCVSQELSCFGISQAVLHLDTLHGNCRSASPGPSTPSIRNSSSQPPILSIRATGISIPDVMGLGISTKSCVSSMFISLTGGV